jgi:hypothetical protein
MKTKLAFWNTKQLVLDELPSASADGTVSTKTLGLSQIYQNYQSTLLLQLKQLRNDYFIYSAKACL